MIFFPKCKHFWSFHVLLTTWEADATFPDKFSENILRLLLFKLSFPSLQVKGSKIIIITRSWRYKLPHQLWNDLKLRIWGNEEILRKSQNWMQVSLVPNLPSKTKNLAKALQNWTKSAIKLSIGILIYSISWNGLKIFCKWSKVDLKPGQVSSGLWTGNYPILIFYYNLLKIFSQINICNQVLLSVLIVYAEELVESSKYELTLDKLCIISN